METETIHWKEKGTNHTKQRIEPNNQKPNQTKGTKGKQIEEAYNTR